MRFPPAFICGCSVLCLTLLAGCTKFDALNALVPPFGYQRTKNIAFGPLPEQKLDLYRPSGSGKPAGIIVFFYGGDWQTGERGDYFFVGQALASKGFIAVLPDYRKYPQVSFPAFIQDGALAVKWAHDHAAELGTDTNHLYLMGHSAGGHIAAMLTVDGRYLQAVGLDRNAIAATAALSAPLDFDPPAGDRRALSMDPAATRPVDAVEPIHFVDGHQPPMLLVHGTADPTVSIDGAKSFAKKVEHEGGPLQTRYYTGKNHVDIVLAMAWPFRWIAPTLKDVTAYFQSIQR